MTQTSKLICPGCSAPRPERGVPCRACGSTDSTQVVEIVAVDEIDVASSIGLLATSGSRHDQTYRIQVQSHGGTRSDARLSGDAVTLSVSGASDVGRRGEAAALNVLMAALRDQGLGPTQSMANDDRGEDAVIGIARARYTVQFVTVPSDWRFRGCAARGSAKAKAGIESALGWIRDAALEKFRGTSPAERPRTVLALDVHHAGVLTSNQIAIAYLTRYPDPRLEFGFAAMWLVGPDASASTQIGSASWDRDGGNPHDRAEGGP